MVTEQIGPQVKNGRLNNTTHKLQWIMHGPVVYIDRLYDELTRDCNERPRLAASIFTKSAKYAEQREYRFAVLNEESDEETVILQISGMMRDALKRIERGLIRAAPPAAKTAGDDEVEPSPRINETKAPVSERTTVTERLTEREALHWETKTPDGQVKSSDSEQRESVRERAVTQLHEPDDEDFQTTVRMDQDDDETTHEQPVSELAQSPEEHGREHSDEEAVQELALEEREWNGRRQEDNDHSVAIHTGTGRAYKSFKDMLNDPASPMSPMKETSQEKACNPEEIARTYGAFETLAIKITQVRMENRQDASSACWHAIQCIRNIYARLGDIVESVWIERERFVVIRLKDSEELNATGRIVIAPGGAYAYCLQLPDKEASSYGGTKWGTIFFPLGDFGKKFETFGWPGKTS